MNDGKKSGIDVTQIPKADVKNLARTTLEAVERYLSDPQIRLAYESLKEHPKKYDH